MNFDFGEVLSCAWQITWKHKVLWGISLLPLLVSIFSLPVWLVIVFQKDFDFNWISKWMQNPVAIVLLVMIYVLIFVASIFLQVASRSSVTLGIYRAEMAAEPVAFMDLIKNGLPYFWRFLGISFLIGAGIMAVFFGVFVVLILLSVVTLGFAMFCLQPFFILLIPLTWLVAAFMEQSESAVIVDRMDVTDALKRAYELIRAHILKYVLITLILYVGIGVLTSLIVFPVMFPMFFFMMNDLNAEMDVIRIMRMQAVLGIILVPLMGFVQGLSVTYIKSAMMLVYLRLTRPAQASLVVPEAVA